MLTLGIETATKVCSVALGDGKNILASYEVNMGMTHSEGLVPQIDQMLVRTGVAKKDLDLIAVSKGPGSFTGLRIGLATAEALAFGLQKPLRAVNTLETLAYNLPATGLTLACLIDAQKGNFYYARYSWNKGVLLEEKTVSILSLASIMEELRTLAKPIVLLGEVQRAEEILPVNVELAPLALRLPRASSVANIAASNYAQSSAEDYFGMEPFYLRRSEAEELWEQRQQKK